MPAAMRSAHECGAKAFVMRFTVNRLPAHHFLALRKKIYSYFCHKQQCCLRSSSPNTLHLQLRHDSAVKMLKVLAAAFVAAVSAANGPVFGVDVSTPVTLSAAQCMRKSNITYGIARAWESVGRFDASSLTTAQSWWDAGFEAVDFYVFPCSFSDPVAQVTQLMGNLTGNARFGRIWLDVETNIDPRCAWSSTNKTANCEYLRSLVDAVIEHAGVPVGVYSSLHMWTLWMADASAPDACDVHPSGPAGADFPLWYPHYDKNPSFSDFTPFGGWTTPSMKQYWDTNNLCGFGVDNNWAPTYIPPAAPRHARV